MNTQQIQQKGNIINIQQKTKYLSTKKGSEDGLNSCGLNFFLDPPPPQTKFVNSWGAPQTQNPILATLPCAPGKNPEGVGGRQVAGGAVSRLQPHLPPPKQPPPRVHRGH